MLTESDRLDGLLQQMRSAFEGRRWEETIQLFEELRNFQKLPRNARVEATCLAARAMASMNNRPAARKLLSPIATIEHAKASSYAHLAQAYMDLRNYREVARICQKIISLSDTA